MPHPFTPRDRHSAYPAENRARHLWQSEKTDGPSSPTSPRPCREAGQEAGQTEFPQKRQAHGPRRALE